MVSEILKFHFFAKHMLPFWSSGIQAEDPAEAAEEAAAEAAMDVAPDLLVPWHWLLF